MPEASVFFFRKSNSNRLHRLIKDTQGRFLAIEMEIENNEITFGEHLRPKYRYPGICIPFFFQKSNSLKFIDLQKIFRADF